MLDGRAATADPRRGRGGRAPPAWPRGLGTAARAKAPQPGLRRGRRRDLQGLPVGRCGQAGTQGRGAAVPGGPRPAGAAAARPRRVGRRDAVDAGDQGRRRPRPAGPGRAGHPGRLGVSSGARTLAAHAARLRRVPMLWHLGRGRAGHAGRARAAPGQGRPRPRGRTRLRPPGTAARRRPGAGAARAGHPRGRLAASEAAARRLRQQQRRGRPGRRRPPGGGGRVRLGVGCPRGSGGGLGSDRRPWPGVADLHRVRGRLPGPGPAGS
jgi:23S rRNA pseudouridine2605 synthase